MVAGDIQLRDRRGDADLSVRDMKRSVVKKYIVFATLFIAAGVVAWYAASDGADTNSVPDEFIESIIIRYLSQQKSNERVMEFRLRDIKTRRPWTHFCLIGEYGKNYDVKEYAKEVHVDLNSVDLYKYFDGPGEWSIMYFANQRYLQISFTGICLSQYRFNIKCASLVGGVIAFERNGVTRECPDGSFSVSGVREEK